MKFGWFFLALATAGLMQACEDENRNSAKVPTAVQTAFEGMFPGVSQVKWEGRNGYMIADFHDGSYAASAWFDGDGIWYMTETDIPFETLPAAVKEDFAAGEYAAWHVDDVDKLQREGMETLYVIEVERGETEVDLHYSGDGVLLKAVIDSGDDSNDDLLPQELPVAVTEFIARKYPGARITEAEREKKMLEVEILDGRIPREVWFDTANAWVYTKTEITRNEVPSVVIQAWEASRYASYELDDIDHYEGPDGEWYIFELEQDDKEVELRIEADGTIR